MPTTTRDNRFRVVCPGYTEELGTLEEAHRWIFLAESESDCPSDHQIEARDERGHWHPLHVWLTIQITSANLGARVDTGDGPLVKAEGGWTDAAVDSADSSAEPGSEDWRALLGSHTRATLSADGRAVDTTDWCRCSPIPDADSWVRYERWEAAQQVGRVAHGYACPNCRKVQQSG